MEQVTVVGAGLAGCEATWQLVKRNIPVRLIEMRPKKESPAFHTDRFAELVCSNSLRSNAMNNAVGILKEELRQMDSLIMKSADMHAVPAGSALAVDRETFHNILLIQSKIIHWSKLLMKKCQFYQKDHALSQQDL